MADTVAPSSRVRDARLRAGMAQSELAQRSGVPQPHISAIESGKVAPTEQMVQRLLHAARVRPSVVLSRHRQRVHELAAARHGHNVRVFGSVARGNDREDSDVDLLVDFDADTSIFAVAGLTAELENLLGTRVDVVSDGGVDSPALNNARAEAVPL